nr:unnamed protein product [Naegleria fowleri]
MFHSLSQNQVVPSYNNTNVQPRTYEQYPHPQLDEPLAYQLPINKVPGKPQEHPSVNYIPQTAQTGTTSSSSDRGGARTNGGTSTTRTNNNNNVNSTTMNRSSYDVPTNLKPSSVFRNLSNTDHSTDAFSPTEESIQLKYLPSSSSTGPSQLSSQAQQQLPGPPSQGQQQIFLSHPAHENLQPTYAQLVQSPPQNVSIAYNEEPSSNRCLISTTPIGDSASYTKHVSPMSASETSANPTTTSSAKAMTSAANQTGSGLYYTSGQENKTSIHDIHPATNLNSSSMQSKTVFIENMTSEEGQPYGMRNTIHSVHELDPEGYKAEKEFTWAVLMGILLCVCGCWCCSCFPFIAIAQKFRNSTSERARRFSHFSKVIMLTVFTTLVCIGVIGIVVAIVVPTVMKVTPYRRPQSRFV